MHPNIDLLDCWKIIFYRIDPDGNLIFTGTDLTVSPEITMTYMLEVISDLDGFKDYDEIQIIVSPNRIESLVPNPVSTQLTIDYVAENVSWAVNF